MRVSLVCLLLFGMAWAQSFQRLSGAQDVAGRLVGARQQIIYVTPLIDSERIAEALRQSVVERGVRVYLLVSPAWVEAPGSYVASLAALSGVQVRLANVDRSFALLDVDETAVVLEGALLGSGSAAFLRQASYALTDGDVISTRSALFAEVWEGALPYVSLVDRLESPEVEPEGFDLSILGGL